MPPKNKPVFDPASVIVQPDGVVMAKADDDWYGFANTSQARAAGVPIRQAKAVGLDVELHHLTGASRYTVRYDDGTTTVHNTKTEAMIAANKANGASVSGNTTPTESENHTMATIRHNVFNPTVAFPPLSQGDPDDIDRLVADNGGGGEWEFEQAAAIQRWSFPRFVGATEDADMYLSRTGIGPHDTDVETLVAWMAEPRNIVGAILLLGEPGTGKTALIEAAVTHSGDLDPDGNVIRERGLTTVVCTPDHTKDSLFLRFVGEGKGDPIHPDDPDSERSPYTLGPIPYAAKHGHVLYMDEFMLLIDGVKPLVYPLADGRRFLPEGNVDGSPLEVHPDFRLVLSSNPSVRGASLPEPVGSRCASTTLTIETSREMLLDLGIDDAIVAAWEALGDAHLWRPQIREVRLADHWYGIDETQAVSAFLPEHCPTGERAAVRDTVVSIIGGGSVRPDGRLVVS